MTTRRIIHFFFTKKQESKVPALVTMPTTQTLRELAIEAATTADLNSFSLAYHQPDPSQTARLAQSFAKDYPALSRAMNVCNSGLVKQLCFIKPNYKLALLSCPFPASNSANEAVVAGSLGDGFNICPVTIRIRNVTEQTISVATSSKTVTNLKMPTSTSNPLEEEGPPPPAEVAPEIALATNAPPATDAPQEVEPAGPDRIKIVISDPDEVPCFVSVPKVFPFPVGHSLPAALITDMIPNIPSTEAGTTVDTFLLWFETMKYGVEHLKNYSIHTQDTMFVYNSLNRDDFRADRLVSRFTTTVTYMTQDDDLYHQVQQ